MGIFDNLSGAGVHKGYDDRIMLEEPGEHIVQIDKIKQVQSRLNEQFVFVEATILVSDNKTYREKLERKPIEFSVCFPFTGKGAEYGMKDWNAFLLAVSSVDTEDEAAVDACLARASELSEKLTAEANPAKGTRMYLTTVNRQSKDKSKVFTNLRWGRELTEEESKKLDAG